MPKKHTRERAHLQFRGSQLSRDSQGPSVRARLCLHEQQSTSLPAHVHLLPAMTVPGRFANDLTNLARTPLGPSSAAQQPKPTARSRRPPSYRQTSLADAFAARTASPVASTSSSPLSNLQSDVGASARRVATSSAFGTSPLRPYDENAGRLEFMDEDASSDVEDSVDRCQKRRKVSPTSPFRGDMDAEDMAMSLEDPWLVAAFDTSVLSRVPSLPASRPLAGEQFSAYEVMRRRDLGLRTRPSQGELAVVPFQDCESDDPAFVPQCPWFRG